MCDGIDMSELTMKKKFLAEVNSYLGIMGHYKTNSLRTKMIMGILNKEYFSFFKFDKVMRKAIIIKRKRLK
jgi:hypothetical protein